MLENKKTSNFYITRPSIALETGEAEAALLEKIAVFCRGKAHTLKGCNGKWIYNSVASWKEQHFQHWSESKIYRALKSLEEKNLIISKKASFRGTGLLTKDSNSATINAVYKIS